MKSEHKTNESLLALEHALKEKLNPVQPDKKFVGSLRARLENSPSYGKQYRAATMMLTLAAGLVIGLVVFLIGRNYIQESA